MHVETWTGMINCGTWTSLDFDVHGSSWNQSSSRTKGRLCLKIKSEWPSPYVISRLSRVWLFATLWTIAHQGLLSVVFSRQEYWSGLPFPPPGDLPDPGIEPSSLTSPALAGGFFTVRTTWEACGASRLLVCAQLSIWVMTSSPWACSWPRFVVHLVFPMLTPFLVLTVAPGHTRLPLLSRLSVHHPWPSVPVLSSP